MSWSSLLVLFHVYVRVYEHACLWAHARACVRVCVCVCVCVCVLFHFNKKWELVRMFPYLFRSMIELSVSCINHLPMTAPKSLNSSNNYKLYSGGVCVDDAEIHFVFTCQLGSKQPDSPASCCLLFHKLACEWFPAFFRQFSGTDKVVFRLFFSYAFWVAYGSYTLISSLDNAILLGNWIFEKAFANLPFLLSRPPCSAESSQGCRWFFNVCGGISI